MGCLSLGELAEMASTGGGTERQLGTTQQTGRSGQPSAAKQDAGSALTPSASGHGPQAYVDRAHCPYTTEATHSVKSLTHAHTHTSGWPTTQG